jgi:hypothetical protein
MGKPYFFSKLIHPVQLVVHTKTKTLNELPVQLTCTDETLRCRSNTTSMTLSWVQYCLSSVRGSGLNNNLQLVFM